MRSLLGLHPSSEELFIYIASIADHIVTPNATNPEVKSYPDAVYMNYYALGLSLLFTPLPGYKPKTGLASSELNNDQLVLDSIDVYNIPKPASSDPRSKGTSSRAAELAFSSFPVFPIILDVLGEVKDKDDKVDFVQCLGEPDRKGGGAGPSSGSIGIWCECLGATKQKGPQAWERGKDAAWKVMTLFSPSSGK
ncbi:hypothetical protein FPV67DRAFT_1466373 [Lyophyllum atratum]|nr:hypothetical protein FPV67DRAFT_1466373 [Lyophyllum atratum]